MRLAYFDIVNPKKLYVLPKRTADSPLFSLRGAEYVQQFFQQIRGVGNIGIATIRGGRVTHRSLRRY